MNIKINWDTVRDPAIWEPHKLLKPITVPTRWPKGQSPTDRLYWLDIALLQQPWGASWRETKEIRRLNSLYNQALSFLNQGIAKVI